MGFATAANGNFVTALGSTTRATGDGSVAIGALTAANGAGATAIGAGARANGVNSQSLGTNSSATGLNTTSIGADSQANGLNAQAFGAGAIANGRNVIAIGSGAQALGFNTNGVAIGAGSFADGTNVLAVGAGASATGSNATAFGAGAMATGNNSTALGAGARTTRDNQVVVGTTTTQVTVPNLAGNGASLVQATSDGTLQRTGTTIGQITSSLTNLGKAVESSGAISAALTAVPQVSLDRDEPARCGIGTGGYGSQYAVAAGCALRVADRVHLNGALSYTPSIDYGYGSTPAIAGRMGFSFPLGKIERSQSASEQQIADLKEQLAKLQAAQVSGQSTPDSAIIVALQRRISELEHEKATSEAENRRQNAEIDELRRKIADQDLRFQKMMEQIRTLLPAVGRPSPATSRL